MSFIINPPSSGGGGTPALPLNSVQFNNAGAFGGNALLSLDVSGSLLTVPQSVISSDKNFIIQNKNILSAPDAGGGLFLNGASNGVGGFGTPIFITGGDSTLSGSGRVEISTGSGITATGDIRITPGSSSGIASTPGNVRISSAVNSGTGSHGYIRLRAIGDDAIVIHTSASFEVEIGFYGATPIVRPTVAIAAAAFVAGVGVPVQDVSTFDGYTVAQIAKALRNLGLLT